MEIVRRKNKEVMSCLDNWCWGEKLPDAPVRRTGYAEAIGLPVRR